MIRAYSRMNAGTDLALISVTDTNGVLISCGASHSPSARV